MVIDYEMWLRIAHKTQIYILDKTLAAFRLMPETKTGSSTHIMYLEEFQVSRKYWMNLPFQRRLQTAFAANRHVATKLLDVAEHFELNGIQPGAVRGLLFRSLRYWPGFVISPRAIFTGLETVARSTLVLAALKKCHRGYLGVKWRLLIWRRQRVGK